MGDRPPPASPLDAAPAHRAWKSSLEAALGCEVRLVATRSRKRPLQLRVLRRARPEQGQGELIELRLHPIFDEAPSELQGEVARWIRAGARARGACRSIDQWIRAGLERVPPPAPAADRLRPRGAVHDLARLAEELRLASFSARFPDPASLPPITWGRRAGARTRRSLRLGSCDPDGCVVRIHPVLDQPGVPEFFVRFVLYHELLHALLPPRQTPAGRWVHHGPEFRAREREFPDYERALRWEQEHLGALIRSARRGVPLRVRVETPPAPLPAARTGGLETIRRMVQRLLF